MNTYVIDSSVAVKWAIQEENSIEAIRYTGHSISRIAPDFILYECNAAIQKRVWIKEIDENYGWNAYRIIFSRETLVLYDSKQLIHPAYRLAVELSHAVYDCLYLALAIEQSARLVTADLKFYTRVQSSPYANIISWVEDPPILT